MTPRLARWIAWCLVGLYFSLSIPGLYFQILTNTTPGNLSIPMFLFVVAVIVVGIWPIIGAQIVTHHPRHPVGWLLHITFPIVAIDMFTLGYASYAEFVTIEPRPIPGLILIWLNVSGMPFAIVCMTLMNLLFPTGKLLTPRWTWVVWTSLGALLIYLGLQTVEPGQLSLFPSLDNPYAVSDVVWAMLAPFYFAIVAILALCNLASLFSLYLRLHYAQGDERQQVKWLIVPATLFWLGTPGASLSDYDATAIFATIGVGLHIVSVPAIVIAVAFAIFKYHLYDFEWIVSRTVVYGALTASVIGLYVLLVGGAGLILQQNATLAGVMLTGVLAVVVFRPLHAFLQQGVDRVMFGGTRLAPFQPGHAPEPTSQTIAATPPVTKSRQPTSRWLALAQIAWYPAAALAFGILLAAIPGFIIIGSGGVVDPRFTANHVPWVTVLLWVTIALAILTSLFSLALAAMLFARRADDKMALLTSYVLLAYGVIMSGPLEALEAFLPGMSSITSSYLIPFFQPFILLLFAVFPDGRFVPRWTRWTVLLAFLTAPLSLFWMQHITQSSLDFSQPGVAVLLAANVVLAVGIWISLVYAQIYRYQRVSTPRQKQQTKWGLYGVAVWLTIQMLTVLPWLYTYTLPPNTPYPAWLAVVTPLWLISIVAIPLTLTIAVLRYHLFEIDYLINRSLLYGALTLAVIAFYVLMVTAMGLLFQAQHNLVSALVATAIVAILVQPLREQLQQGVNRLVYGERDDPVEALAKLGRRLETAIPPDKVLPILVETIADTLKLPYVAILLPASDARHTSAAYGKPTADVVRFPLIFQGQPTGQLIVGHRDPGSNFNAAEMRLLRNIARQSGSAVHTVRLTDDLLRSRQQLVTTREEERRRLRRDLHDGLGATLAALNLEAAVLRRMIRRDPVKAEALVDEFRQNIRNTIEGIRHLVYELRPPTLDQLGLAEAVRLQAVQCSRSEALGEESVQVEVKAPDMLPTLPAAVEVAAYRIVQEALTNVVHHARARHCVVRLEIKDGLRVEILDDGVGVACGSKVGNGLGLVSLCERAEELGGTCRIEPIADGGTRVLALLPLLEV